MGKERKVKHGLFGRHRWTNWSEPRRRPSNLMLGGNEQERRCTVCNYVETKLC